MHSGTYFFLNGIAKIYRLAKVEEYVPEALSPLHPISPRHASNKAEWTSRSTLAIDPLGTNRQRDGTILRTGATVPIPWLSQDQQALEEIYKRASRNDAATILIIK